MTQHDDERLGRPDARRDAGPESEECLRGKEWSYAGLGLVFVTLMVLIVTGIVPIYPG